MGRGRERKQGNHQTTGTGFPPAKKKASKGAPPPNLSVSKKKNQAPPVLFTPGRKAQPHPGKDSRPFKQYDYICGLANQFTFVELEKDGIWKVSVPANQRFSRQFLAGVEVWASQMMSAGQVDLLRSIQPTFVSEQPVTHVPPPPPPPPPPSVGRPHAPGQADSSCTVGMPPESPPAQAYDLNSLKAALPCMPPPPQRQQPLQDAPPTEDSGPTDSAFVQPKIKGRSCGKDSPSGASSSRYSYSDLTSADLRGDGAAGDTADELLCGDEDSEESDFIRSEDEMDDEEEDGEGAERFSDEGSEGVVVDSDDDDEDNGDGCDGDADADLDGDLTSDLASLVAAAADANPDKAKRNGGGPRTLSHQEPANSRSSKIMVAAQNHSKQASGPKAVISGAPPFAAPGKANRSGGPTFTRTSTARHEDRGSPVKISLHLERQSLTDVEMCLLVRWYKERVPRLVELTKLWLFDNRIGDAGAEACAELLHSGTKEVHLSHNFITTEGAKLLLSRCPAERAPGCKPLWLRMEWNLISPEDLVGSFLQLQREQRGLVVDVPKVVKAGQSHSHEMSLKMSRTPLSGVHVQLPWLECQKQPPSVSALLKDTQSAYTKGGPAPAAMAPRPPAQTQCDASGSTPSALSLPAPQAPPMYQGGFGGVMETDGRDGGYRSGPLLIFPDTSALLSMLGANTEVSRAPITMDMLQQLALEGRFGRGGLQAYDRTFIVIADSVMKQLDSLKSLPATRVHIRKFLSEGLEAMGPAGTDFLTVLGAHEGEGQLLEAGGLGVAGSDSPHIGSKGQKVDYKIVEVALYFQKEVLRSAPPTTNDNNNIAGGDAFKAALPVMLLSNDNAQITIARAHGLPAFRLSSAEDVPQQMMQYVPGSKGPALSAGSLRAMLAPQATRGLGTVAGQSLQHQFDEAISTMRALASSLKLATYTLQRLSDCASSSELHTNPGAVVAGMREALLLPALPAAHPAPPELDSAESGPVEDVGEALSPMVGPFFEMVDAVEGQLVEWEALVKSHQAPSRVAQWAAAT